MKKVPYKIIILFLIYALALNPLTTVLADQAGGILSNAITKHCEMESKADKNSMNMDDASASMSHNMEPGCKCSKDCNEGDCGQQCADCGHLFAGIPIDILVLTHSKSNQLKLSSDFRHQLPSLMHYRPPITLHS
jgi:hypothetical protein